MGLFNDNDYENMEWLEKVIEPYIFPFNNILKQIPDEITITPENIYELLGNNNSKWVSLHIMLDYLIHKQILKCSKDDIDEISEIFTAEIPDNYGIDIYTKKASGEIKLVKKVKMIEEKDIPSYVSKVVSSKLIEQLNSNNVETSRIKEIMDILECDKESMSARSVWKKLGNQRKRIIYIIENDIWRIRDVTLIYKLVDWIIMYIKNGNLAALSNIMRLKCMTHSGAPIYSMEEIV